MATDIVPSLFGLTPEMYQQRQAAQADAAALQYAQLTPMQQAQYAIGRGAYGLAGALGGALGAQDPQLQLISARNSVAKQINYNDPASIMQGVESLSQAGDTVGAMQLADVARRLQSEMAQTFQRTAAGQASLAQAGRERQQATPADIAKATRIGEIVTALQVPELDAMTRANLEAQLTALRPEAKDKPGAAQLQIASEIANQKLIVDTLRNQPASPERDAALNRASYTLEGLERQLPQPKPDAAAKIDVIGVTRDKGLPVYVDKNTDQQFIYETVDGKQIRKPYTGSVSRITSETQVKVDVPGVKPVFDTAGMRSKVQDTIKPQLATITASEQALQSIEDSIATNNFVSFNAARVQLARALGDSQLSRQDIKQAGGDPSILGGLVDTVNVAFTSTPSPDTQKKIRDTLRAINSVARRQAKAEISTQRDIAIKAPGADATAIDRALMFPQLQGADVPTPAVAGGRVSPSDQALLDKYAPRKP
jgi:hypothetical protein